MFQLTQEYLQVCSCKSEQSWMDDLGILFRPRATLAYRPAANSRAVGKIDVIFTVLGSGNLADKYNFLEY